MCKLCKIFFLEKIWKINYRRDDLDKWLLMKDSHCVTHFSLKEKNGKNGVSDLWLHVRKFSAGQEVWT